MKYSEFLIGENIVSFHNTVFGDETVAVNNEVLSEKFSIFGTVHRFEIDENSYELQSRCRSFSSLGVELELRENGKLVAEQSIDTTIHSLAWITMGIFGGLAFIYFMGSL